MSQGNLYILSAPSGAGKSSLISALLEKIKARKKWCLFHTQRVLLVRRKSWCALLFCFSRRI